MTTNNHDNAIEQAANEAFKAIREKYPDMNWVDEPGEQDYELSAMLYRAGAASIDRRKVVEEFVAAVEEEWKTGGHIATLAGYMTAQGRVRGSIEVEEEGNAKL